MRNQRGKITNHTGQTWQDRKPDIMVKGHHNPQKLKSYLRISVLEVALYPRSSYFTAVLRYFHP